MATTPDDLAEILAALAPLPVRARSMFGEVALYLDDRLPAFVADGVLGLKVTALEAPELTPDLLGPIYPGPKDYWRIPGRLLADGGRLRELFVATARAVPPTKPRRRRA